ncbi:MAG: AbrB/MazE/SpoVT family DNA-binding domain-containing protein [Propionibacteriaceae bacterium]|jgi:AbrB family looped-hinge helix DNA binding protein|nr:AbrB/MazE/SpoVT family DNA-binding domain-containing protein [Propionibacteriaceae bacterium]
MTRTYSKVTAKGQITLPAAARRRFGLRPGIRATITVDDQGIRVSAPPDLAEVRGRLQAEMRAAGTWAGALEPHEAWADDAAGRHGQP